MGKTKSPAHCKGCQLLTNYHARGDLGDTTVTRKWCCKFSKFANKAVGECKLKDGKRVRDERKG